MADGNNNTVAWVAAVGTLLAGIAAVVTVLQNNKPDAPATEQTAPATSISTPATTEPAPVVRAEPPPQRQASFPSRWEGYYRCQDALGDGETRYAFELDGDRIVRAHENWRRSMLSGTVIYDVEDTRSSDGGLRLTTSSAGGYSVQFRLSDDRSTLNGVYEMHPNCQTIVIRPE